MFSRTSRIKKADVGKIIKEGVSYHSPSFSLKVLRNNEAKNMFSVVVSKKVAKTAVSRNANKRRVREAIKKTLNIKQGFSFVLFIKKDLKTNTFKDLSNEIFALLARVG